MAIIIDSYSESNQDSGRVMQSAGDLGWAQAFTGIAGDISSCKLYLDKFGSPTGNATIELYAQTGTFGSSSTPTGAALASATLDISTLNTSFALYEITFSVPYTASANTKYCLSIKYSGGDGSNYIRVGTDNSTPTHSGDMSRWNGTSWNAGYSDDMCFYIYANLVLIDSYSETNQSNDVAVRSGSNIAVSQSFDPGATSYSVTSCKFDLKKAGSPTGNATAVLYAHSGTYGTSSVPTGAALATSNNFDVSTLTTSYVLNELTFPTPYIIDANTKYTITFNFSGGDASNEVFLGSDNSSPTHSGNIARYVSSWTAAGGEDACFYVYGTAVTASTSDFFQLF